MCNLMGIFTWNGVAQGVDDIYDVLKQNHFTERFREGSPFSVSANFQRDSRILATRSVGRRIFLPSLASGFHFRFADYFPTRSCFLLR